MKRTVWIVALLGWNKSLVTGSQPNLAFMAPISKLDFEFINHLASIESKFPYSESTRDTVADSPLRVAGPFGKNIEKYVLNDDLDLYFPVSILGRGERGLVYRGFLLCKATAGLCEDAYGMVTEDWKDKLVYQKLDKTLVRIKNIPGIPAGLVEMFDFNYNGVRQVAVKIGYLPAEDARFTQENVAHSLAAEIDVMEILKDDPNYVQIITHVDDLNKPFGQLVTNPQVKLIFPLIVMEYITGQSAAQYLRGVQDAKEFQQQYTCIVAQLVIDSVRLFNKYGLVQADGHTGNAMVNAEQSFTFKEFKCPRLKYFDLGEAVANQPKTKFASELLFRSLVHQVHFHPKAQTDQAIVDLLFEILKPLGHDAAKAILAAHRQAHGLEARIKDNQFRNIVKAEVDNGFTLLLTKWILLFCVIPHFCV